MGLGLWVQGFGFRGLGFRVNGKENGHYHHGVILGIKVFRTMETTGFIWGYIGIMEGKMEATD